MSKPVTTKQQYWLTHLESAAAFDGSIAEYARSQHLSSKALYRWQHRFKDRLPLATSPPPSEHKQPIQSPFSEVIHAPITSARLTLHINHQQLDFSHLPDPQWLAQLITASQCP